MSDIAPQLSEASSLLSDCLLVIQPSGVWDLPMATLFYAEEHEFFFVTKGKVFSAELEADAPERAVAEACEKSDYHLLYEMVDQRKFRTEEQLWQKAEKEIRQYARKVIDKRIYELITLAGAKGVRLFFRRDGKDELLKKRQLTLEAEPAVPLMKFSRDDEGITYTLRLADNEGEPLTLCQSNSYLITESPCLVKLNERIFTLPSHFSGKLLLPFLSKPSTFIPRRIQDEYFRRFILKNTYKTEIEAEGFEIEQKTCEPRVRLVMEKNLLDEGVLTVEFIYADVTFRSDEARQMYVRLEETDDSFRFVKTVRQGDWEAQQLSFLLDTLQMPPKGSMRQIVDWLSDHGDDLKKAGIEFVQPSEEKYYLGAATLEQTSRWENDWLKMRIVIRLSNGKTIPFIRLKNSILRGEKEYILEDGSRFLIPDEWLARYGGAIIFGRDEGTTISVHRSQLAVIEKATLAPATEQPLIHADSNLPKGLKAKLRPYQRTGYKWLCHHFFSRTGCCLSDDMGLGKTVQAIALMLKYKQMTSPSRRRKADAMPTLFTPSEMSGEAESATSAQTLPFETILVLSPASVVYNWRNEIARFAPKLTVCEYVGPTESRRQKREKLMQWDVVVTSYATFRNDVEYLGELMFGLVVFDESQSFKNRKSGVYHAMERLQARHRMALSGTPLENSLSDLWSLMHILNPLLLGSHRTFNDTYIRPLSEDLNGDKAQILRTLVAPYFLKRTKEEVLTELPSRQDELVMCSMTDEQQRLYEEELSKARNALLAEEVAQQLTTAHVMKTIVRLRQVACHPRLMGQDIPSGKFDEVFSRLETIYATDHKVLIFSEFVSLLRLVAEEMENRSWAYEMLTGETINRERVIDRFSQNPDCRFFLISLKAGGVGLNLTSADYVFLLDPWWNRAAEEQAISRAHRMGQQRSVFVYRFISCGTLEEDILRLQDRKQSLAEAVLPFIMKEKE